MKFKKILLIFLSIILIFSSTACKAENNENNINDNIDPQDYEVWCIDSFEKVLASQPKSYYENKITDGINILAARNDNESGQIIVSAQKELSFVVGVGDLVDISNPTNKISNSNFAVFTQLYISVSTNLHGNGQPTGMYPDAILPQDNAIKHKKNVILPESNGGAWINFYIPENTKAGTYRGNATVSIGKNIIDVPITLTVCDVVISQETTSKSLFTVNWNYLAQYELDNSQEMRDKYNDFLLSHRLCSTSYSGHSDVDGIVEDLYKAHLKGVSTLGVSGSNDYEYIKEQIIGCAKKALLNNDNFISKLIYYDYIIDEPFYVNYAEGVVQNRVESFHEMILEAVEELNRDSSFNSVLGQEIIEDVNNFTYLVTDYGTDAYGNSHRYTAPIRDKNGDLYHYPNYVTICPKPDGYCSEEERLTYKNGAETWWYNCNEPSHPYPGYHIDDTMTSHCAMAWMQAEYDVVGNLYWCCNYFDDNGSIMENPYLVAQAKTGANGEGAIIYPGKMFDVDGPVSSLRLEAIRDGQEDYELICSLKKLYESKGQSANKIINRITSVIYNESSIVGGAKEYRSAREILLSVLATASSPANVMVTDVQESETASGKKYTFEIKTASGVELYSDGVKLAQEETYIIEKYLTEEKNYLSLEAKKNGISSLLKLYLGGKQVIYNPNMFNNFNDYNISGNVSSAIYDGTYNVYNMTLNGSEKSDIVYKHSSINSISASTLRYKIIMFNYEARDIDFKVYITYSGTGKEQSLSGKFNPGLNELTFDIFPTVNWAKKKSIKEITISVSGVNNLGIGSIMVYGV